MTLRWEKLPNASYRQWHDCFVDTDKGRWRITKRKIGNNQPKFEIRLNGMYKGYSETLDNAKRYCEVERERV